jgi:putative endonuclease
VSDWRRDVSDWRRDVSDWRRDVSEREALGAEGPGDNRAEGCEMARGGRSKRRAMAKGRGMTGRGMMEQGEAMGPGLGEAAAPWFGPATGQAEAVRLARRRRGARAYLAGRSAEEATARHYEAAGRPIVARRWRGIGGEIDLIAREGDGVVFIEVKQAKSFEAAAERLSLRQMGRISAAAAEFLAGEPGGEITEARFDVALVDGAGRVRILENAFEDCACAA